MPAERPPNASRADDLQLAGQALAALARDEISCFTPLSVLAASKNIGVTREHIEALARVEAELDPPSKPEGGRIAMF